MTGVLTGGWSYVWAAYGLTTAALLIYAVSLFMRLKEERQR
jgi:heme exporter protein D